MKINAVYTTFNTIDKDYEMEKKQLATSEGQKLNLATVFPNPLMNDIARDQILVRERQLMYEHYFNNPIPIDYYKRSVEYSSFNGSRCSPVGEQEAEIENELMVKGEKFY
jgi:hypothetical protein